MNVGLLDKSSLAKFLREECINVGLPMNEGLIVKEGIAKPNLSWKRFVSHGKGAKFTSHILTWRWRKEWNADLRLVEIKFFLLFTLYILSFPSYLCVSPKETFANSFSQVMRRIRSSTQARERERLIPLYGVKVQPTDACLPFTT